MPDGIDEIGETEKDGKEKCVEREFGMFEQCLRFFHGFFFSECFQKNQEQVKNDQRRKVEKRLKFVRERKQEITDKKEYCA